jgi:hypothetical protein
MSDEEWENRLTLEKHKKLNLKQLEMITFDKVIAGNKDSEHEHGLTGKSTTGSGNDGILADKVWRVATAHEGFSYKMKVPGNVPVALLCKFMGREQNESWNCTIKIDTTILVELKRGKDDSYPVIPFESVYPIPFELTKDKNSTKVIFEVRGVLPPISNRWNMPRLMGISIIKMQE